MKKDIFRHKLLELLSEKFVNSIESNQQLGITYEYLQNHFNLDRKELFKLIAELFSNKEIALYNPTGASEKLGIFATNDGISSYSSEKYKRRHYNFFKSNIKDFVQIIIPVLSLIVAVMAIYFKIENFNTEHKKAIHALSKEIEILKNKENDNVKKLPNTIKKKVNYPPNPTNK